MPTWLFSRLSNRQFLLAGAVIVGLWAGLSAVVLKATVHYLQTFLKSLAIGHSWIYFISPATGILMTYLFIKYILGGELVKGTSHVMFAIARKSSFLPRKEVYSHLATSALTVGMGGSAGLESPIVQTGSAIGSVFSSFFPVGYRDRTLLLACGASAGIATAFNAPIAGVLFALEVLLVDVSVSAFIPLLLAGATGSLCSAIILAENIPLSFREISHFNYHNIPFYIALGIASGLLSAFYLRAYAKSEIVIKSKLRSGTIRLITGGAILGVLVILFPALFGEGYSSITSLARMDPDSIFEGSPLKPFLSNNQGGVAIAVFAVAIFKVFAVSLTLNAGGNGGNFAPALLVGACLGFSLSFGGNALGVTHLPVPNFCLVAMAGVLTGIFHAPLMAVFLIAEITGGYDLIIPLMVVSALSTAVSKYFNSFSLDEAKLHQQGGVPRFGRDIQILSGLTLGGCVENDFVGVKPNDSLKMLTKAVSQSRRNIFPVIDEQGKLLGLIALEDIREIMFDSTRYDSVNVSQLMRPPIATVNIGDDMITVMEKFDKSGVWNIPLLDQGQYVGFISKSRIFSLYRDRLSSN